jgi:hypothetical protein
MLMAPPVARIFYEIEYTPGAIHVKLTAAIRFSDDLTVVTT